jgi:hypothetical protein
MVTTSAAGTSWPALIRKDGIEMNNSGAFLAERSGLSSLRLNAV